jgi:superfamily II DNA or RNA helicase
MAGTLRNYPFKISYGPADDRLRDFYIPALERSVRYDRTTGFFSSASLAVAAAGVVRLIANGGKMRLLTGARLSENDVEAIRRGSELRKVVEERLVGCLADPGDTSLRARLEALAWMVAQGHLEIKVVLPLRDGVPLPASESLDYYHPKESLFLDAAGNKLATQGSANETEQGWRWNYEVFSVYTNWELVMEDGTRAATAGHLAGVESRFNRLWNGIEEDWAALDIPSAAKERLLQFRPDAMPTLDPLERRNREEPASAIEPDADEAKRAEARERIIAQFLRDAPFFSDVWDIGFATSPTQPYPHQRRVVRDTVRLFPRSFLFCDEVGLGKTIEAGGALRQLIITERVKRALLLVPKSVLRQWQEELWEKFVLNIPRYEDRRVVDAFGRELPFSALEPWNAFPFLLASSQLVKRRDRQEGLLNAEPWDLVIVDEAHHARRKDFRQDIFRPNRLLELLLGPGNRPGLRDKTKAIYLLTATPMQVHPVEVWDLLQVVGLGGKWGGVQEYFLQFFGELRKPNTAHGRKWDFLGEMVQDYFDLGGKIDENLRSLGLQELGAFDWEVIESFPRSLKREELVFRMSAESRAFLDTFLRQHTPLRQFIWRNTRRLLRKYVEMGLLNAKVPERDPQNEWIEFEPEEMDLYERIDEYISDFYQKYEAERKGLGFIMTVYRRRLTSSFYALLRSLRRRRDFLQGLLPPTDLLEDEDIEQESLANDVEEQLTDLESDLSAGELDYLDDFIADLERLGADSKLHFLKRQLAEIFLRRDTALVFTQYTDTMDYLREELRPVYGGKVACYSGRGGEWWDGAMWKVCPKETIKEEFRRGETIKILLCTESASEGLNLQTCGVLINYDMPWNPMRVEQRIGRIDRIGQIHDRVWVWNYFYAGTVEATIYQRLSDRIGWFENVVGELQPILVRVAEAIQTLAMLRLSERREKMEELVAAIRLEIQERENEGAELVLEDRLEEPRLTEPLTPVTLETIEGAIIEECGMIGGRLQKFSEDGGITFSPEEFDAHPYSKRLFTYGTEVWNEVLAGIEPPESRERTGFLRLCRKGEIPIVELRSLKEQKRSECRELQSLLDHLHRLPAIWTEGQLEEGLRDFSGKVNVMRRAYRDNCNFSPTAKRKSIESQAELVLKKCLIIQSQLSFQGGLFGDAGGTEPESGLRRLLQIGAPFRGLHSLIGRDTVVSAADPLRNIFLNQRREVLVGKFSALRQRGFALLTEYQETVVRIFNMNLLESNDILWYSW